MKGRERERMGRKDYKGVAGDFGVMDKFIILIVMMISWVYT